MAVRRIQHLPELVELISKTVMRKMQSQWAVVDVAVPVWSKPRSANLWAALIP